MAGSKLFGMLSIILIIDLVFFLFAVGMSDVNNEYNISDTNTGFDYSRSFLSDFDKGNYTLVNKTSDVIPEESQAVSESGTGNIFTDTISTVSNWLKDVGEGISDAAGTVVNGFNYLFNILGGPVYYLSWMGAPQALTWSIAAVWYGLSLLLIIGFIFGRL